jgi:hypothetical protein
LLTVISAPKSEAVWLAEVSIRSGQRGGGC